MRFIFTGIYFLIFYVLFIYKLYVLCVCIYIVPQHMCGSQGTTFYYVGSHQQAWQQALLPPESFWTPQVAFLYVLTIYMHLLIFLVNTDYLFLGSLYIHIKDLLQMLSTAFYLRYLIQRFFSFRLSHHLLFLP